MVHTRRGQGNSQKFVNGLSMRDGWDPRNRVPLVRAKRFAIAWANRKCLHRQRGVDSTVALRTLHGALGADPCAASMWITGSCAWRNRFCPRWGTSRGECRGAVPGGAGGVTEKERKTHIIGGGGNCARAGGLTRRARAERRLVLGQGDDYPDHRAEARQASL